MLHIVIALTSLALSTYLVIRPSERLVATQYALIASTLLSGGALVITNRSQVLHVCTSGLIYLTVVVALLTITQKKLATLPVNAQDKH